MLSQNGIAAIKKFGANLELIRTQGAVDLAQVRKGGLPPLASLKKFFT